jgi:hypothetical protein
VPTFGNINTWLDARVGVPFALGVVVVPPLQAARRSSSTLKKVDLINMRRESQQQDRLCTSRLAFYLNKAIQTFQRIAWEYVSLHCRPLYYFGNASGKQSSGFGLLNFTELPLIKHGQTGSSASIMRMDNRTVQRRTEAPFQLPVRD